MTPMILLHAIEIGGKALIRHYPKQIKDLCRVLSDPNSAFNVKLTHYFKSKDVLKEVYNQDALLPENPLNDEDRMSITGAKKMIEDIGKMQ